jgi:VIT1/CCC1 family predicted Fe2+/Mn2+ transporter
LITQPSISIQEPNNMFFLPSKDQNNSIHTPLLPNSKDTPSHKYEHLDPESSSPIPTSRKTYINFDLARFFSDVTIGLSDGLTVPFALTAGLSALGDSNVIIYGGFAELVAGAISMGLGGYLSAKSEREAYIASLSETKDVVSTDPEKTAELVRECFAAYDFPQPVLDAMLARLRELDDDGEQMKKFLMCFHHNMDEDDYAPSRAYVSGLTVATGYVCGGLVPLAPYLIVSEPAVALKWSILVMVLALFVFGWVKTAFIGVGSWRNCGKSAIEMVVLGGVAAAAAIGCVKLIDG